MERFLADYVLVLRAIADVVATRPRSAHVRAKGGDLWCSAVEYYDPEDTGDDEASDTITAHMNESWDEGARGGSYLCFVKVDEVRARFAELRAERDKPADRAVPESAPYRTVRKLPLGFAGLEV